jgi:ABC-type proline/glycine betaine transport system substrate-binding protein
LVAGTSAIVADSAWGQLSGHRPIILGQVSLSFYAVTGAVVHEVRERLGHFVEVREGPHEEMFSLLGQGAIDLMAAVWLPEGHAAYWARNASSTGTIRRDVFSPLDFLKGAVNEFINYFSPQIRDWCGRTCRYGNSWYKRFR